MINEEDILVLCILAIEELIELLEESGQDNVMLDKLRLLLSDNVFENGKINVRHSLLNEYFHHVLSKYKLFLQKHPTWHLYN